MLTNIIFKLTPQKIMLDLSIHFVRAALPLLGAFVAKMIIDRAVQSQEDPDMMMALFIGSIGLVLCTVLISFFEVLFEVFDNNKRDKDVYYILNP